MNLIVFTYYFIIQNKRGARERWIRILELQRDLYDRLP